MVDSAGSTNKKTIAVTIEEEEEVEEAAEAEPVIVTANAFLEDFDLGFDFSKALKGIKPPEKPVPPTAKLKKINNEGQVIIEFSKDMIVPPLGVIQALTQPSSSSDGRRRLAPQAIKVEVLPGDYSSEQDLEFSYNVTNYSPKQMTIDLKFDKPLYISKDYESKEFLEITFITKFFFFDTEGLFLEEGLKVLREIPSQMPIGGAAQ